jgi:hypothetical protein
VAAIKIDGSYPPRLKLKSGDVVMVHRECYDTVRDEHFTWKFIGAVSSVRGGRLEVLRFGADEGKDVMRFSVHDPKYSVYYLTEDGWPDGVHAFRTRLILEGRLDDALFG